MDENLPHSDFEGDNAGLPFRAIELLEGDDTWRPPRLRRTRVSSELAPEVPGSPVDDRSITPVPT